MRLRATHIAGILLLLASLGVAEGSPTQTGAYRIGGQYIGVLLADDSHATDICSALDDANDALPLGIPAVAIAHYRAAWTMRASAAHTLAVHAVTGSGL